MNIPQNSNGQALMSGSTPVVIASNQSSLLVRPDGIEYYFSPLGTNSTTTQLASGASFVGVIEDVSIYPSISFLAFADQNLTITIDQFIDITGLKLSESRTMSYVASEKLAISFPINGNYIRVTVKNEGGSTTTNLEVNTAYGIIESTNEIQDDYLRGQSAQTTAINNILTPVASANPIDVSKYRSFAIQVVSTGTGGTFIFEGSNDGVNFQAIPVYNQALVVRVPIVTAITATASQIIYEGSCNFKFLRLRIATNITGGSIQAHSVFIHAPLGTSSQVVSNGTAANFLATVTPSGTFTVQGAGAHSAAISGSPVRIGSRVAPTTIASQETSLVAGDTSDVYASTSGQMLIKNFSTSELDITTNMSSAVTVNTVQQILPASGTASIRNYITGLVLYSDTLGAAGNAWILDGQGAIGTSVTIATPGVFTSSTHDLRVGDAIVFTSLGTITGVSTNTIYYVTATSFTTTTFTVATTLGGTAIQITGTSSAFTFYRVLHAIRLQTTALSYPINLVFQTPLRGMANVATNILIPTNLTSGSIYLTTNGYRGF